MNEADFTAAREHCLKLARLRGPADVALVLREFERKQRELVAAGLLPAAPTPPPPPPAPPSLWRRLLAMLG